MSNLNFIQQIWKINHFLSFCVENSSIPHRIWFFSQMESVKNSSWIDGLGEVKWSQNFVLHWHENVLVTYTRKKCTILWMRIRPWFPTIKWPFCGWIFYVLPGCIWYFFGVSWNSLRLFYTPNFLSIMQGLLGLCVTCNNLCRHFPFSTQSTGWIIVIRIIAMSFLCTLSPLPSYPKRTFALLLHTLISGL